MSDRQSSTTMIARVRGGRLIRVAIYGGKFWFPSFKVSEADFAGTFLGNLTSQRQPLSLWRGFSGEFSSSPFLGFSWVEATEWKKGLCETGGCVN